MTSTMLALVDATRATSVLRLMTNEPWRTHGAALTRRERDAFAALGGTRSRPRGASRSTPTGQPPGSQRT